MDNRTKYEHPNFFVFKFILLFWRLRNSCHVEKTLNINKKLWDVSVKLEENRKNKPTPRCMINQVWNSPLYKNPTVV